MTHLVFRPARLALAVSLMLGSPVIWAQATAVASAAMAGGDKVQNIKIAAQPLGDALNAWARQTGVQIAVEQSLVAGKTSTAINASLGAQQALNRLLAGTGLAGAINGAEVVIRRELPAAKAANQVLDEVVVSSSVPDSGSWAGYSEARSVTYVGRETLDRVPQATPSELFRAISGVQMANAYSGVSFDLNIRGLQGQGRVKVLVDGSDSATSSQMSYTAARSHNYIDPDFVAGIAVEKGPGLESGGFGGTVGLRTFSADDLITDPDRNWGIRMRGMLGNNSGNVNSSQQCHRTNNRTGVTTSWQFTQSCLDNLTVRNYTYGMQSFQPVPEGTDVPGSNRSGSVIGAWKPVEFIDLMAGYSKRQSGNYAAGSSGYELGEDYETNGGYYWDGTPARFSYFQPGQEVYGTYNDTESWLAKAGFHFGEQRVEARYNRTESAYVQHRNPSSQIPDVKYNYQSIYQPASHSKQDRYGLEYTWKPANPLFDLKTEVWAVDTVENNWTNGSGSSAMPTDAAAHIKTDAIGAGISNASMFLLGDMDLTLKVGGNYKREEIESNTSVNGMRTTEWGMFGHAEIEATDWLMLDGGLRHNDYKASLDGNSDFEKGASDLSWQTGITMSPAEWLQVFMRRSKGWRAPSARENSSGSCGQWLTRQGIFGDTQWYCAGPGVLRPELSRNTELGVNVLHRSLLRAEDRFGMKLVYFDNDIGDYIHGIPATTLTGFGGIAPPA
ncbi:Outer membrane receptor proteins, mostly Fe transport [Lampropedia hyalina DSM 16112]|uniref:Outer membrane receptor proteins, mostly Fe transport n=1 Tax=Lampropedia hyalina DSM 16112 TaxID=1122156 RepID=A0A1M5AEP9_9BURK|nr:TonB-dependent receptor [Lampropedia hyalina]SHF28780.1 Outer membrane receptor proteins, mostly Fe transport [Lampropedia hyalina DSM 16112]